MADIIQIRRDTLANWTSVDPILADGEWGYETDTGKLKLGNGTGLWSTLPYLIGDVDAIHDNIASEIHAITQKTPPVANDELLIEDSAAAYAKKRVLVSEFSLASHTHTYYDTNAVHDNEAAEIQKLSLVTVAAADVLLIEDESDSWNKKQIVASDFATAGHTHTYYDANAIHDNEANELSALTNKATPAAADVLLIEDSAASYVKKKLLISALPGGGAGSDTTALHDNEANEISAITEKTTPVNDDILVIEDSAASYVKKRLKISNLPGGGLTQAQVLARGLGA